MLPEVPHLREWAEHNRVSLDELARRLGYRLTYVVAVLYGAEVLSDRFIGRFVRVYGAQAATDAFGLSS